MSDARNRAFPVGEQDHPRRYRWRAGAARLTGPLVLLVVGVGVTVHEAAGGSTGVRSTAALAGGVVGIDASTPVGTCYRRDAVDETLLRVTDCGAVHDGVVLGVEQADVTGTGYPTDVAWSGVLDVACDARARTWTGTSALPGTLRIGGLYPVPADFDAGDRTVVCLLDWRTPAAGDARADATG